MKRTVCAVAFAMAVAGVATAQTGAGGAWAEVHPDGTPVQTLLGIGGTNGQAVEIAAPLSTVLNANQSNTEARVFAERTNWTLAADLNVNETRPGLYDAESDLLPGVIASGTQINSYYLWADPEGAAARRYEGSVTFDQPILGVILSRELLNVTDFLGAPGTAYGDNNARGLELGANADRFSLSISGNVLRFNFNTSTATDDIRIITVPAPGAAVMGGLGLMILGRRRRG